VSPSLWERVRARADTLFWRLVLLMWLTLVISHLVAFLVVTRGVLPQGRPQTLEPAPSQGRPPPREPPQGIAQPHEPPPGRSRSSSAPTQHAPLPTFPSLPPGNPLAPRPAGELTDGGRPAMPAHALWLDYGVRLLIIALGALIGARWLAGPMGRLSRASAELAKGLGGEAPPPLPEEGTREVRAAASAFNRMARELHQQFQAHETHMAAVSHDLRTPLTRLAMRIDQQWPAGAAQDAARADLREMDELIGETLALLRERHTGGAARAVDFAALVQALVDEWDEQGQPVSLAPLPTESLRVSGRPLALRRIVDNLTGNALRHAGSARLTLAREAGHAVLCVDDDGPGIAPERLASAFDPWVRLGDAAGAAGGHGLGLAIARDLARRDGAELTLANRAGGGLRARLVLPLAR